MQVLLLFCFSYCHLFNLFKTYVVDILHISHIWYIYLLNELHLKRKIIKIAATTKIAATNRCNAGRKGYSGSLGLHNLRRKIKERCVRQGVFDGLTHLYFYSVFARWIFLPPGTLNILKGLFNVFVTMDSEDCTNYEVYTI